MTEIDRKQLSDPQVFSGEVPICLCSTKGSADRGCGSC